jgi:hypothetical protein
VVRVERGYHLAGDQTTTWRLQSTSEAPFRRRTARLKAENTRRDFAIALRSLDYERLWTPAQDRVQGSRIV